MSSDFSVLCPVSFFYCSGSFRLRNLYKRIFEFVMCFAVQLSMSGAALLTRAATVTGYHQTVSLVKHFLKHLVKKVKIPAPHFVRCVDYISRNAVKWQVFSQRKSNKIILSDLSVKKRRCAPYGHSVFTDKIF